jgi:electron transfer flavoprotein beta subunit
MYCGGLHTPGAQYAILSRRCDLHIVVCIKQVPDSAAVLKVDEAGKVSWGEAPLIVNPWDDYAVEEALLLKEKHGGKVTVLSMGPESAKDALKDPLAKGADAAILLSDPAFGKTDSLGVATVLAAAIKKLGDVDMVLFGQSSIDAQTGTTASAVARRLGFAPLTFVAKVRAIDPAGKAITAERLLEEGKQVVVSKLPAAVSVVKDINQPRYASFMGIRKAAKAAVPVWGAGDLGLEAGALAAKVDWSRTYAPPPREGACDMITGDTPQAIAAALADKIMGEKIL